jgi:hypothetical protein
MRYFICGRCCANLLCIKDERWKSEGSGESDGQQADDGKCVWLHSCGQLRTRVRNLEDEGLKIDSKAQSFFTNSGFYIQKLYCHGKFTIQAQKWSYNRLMSTKFTSPSIQQEDTSIARAFASPFLSQWAERFGSSSLRTDDPLWPTFRFILPVDFRLPTRCFLH